MRLKVLMKVKQGEQIKINQKEEVKQLQKEVTLAELKEHRQVEHQELR